MLIAVCSDKTSFALLTGFLATFLGIQENICIYLYSHSLNKPLLNSYYILGSLLNIRDSEMKRQKKKKDSVSEFSVYREKQKVHRKSK